MVTGHNPTYISGDGHLAIPLATDVGIRKTHTPKTPRPTGLDWSKHRAPEPEQPSAGETAVSAWPCREDVEQQFHAADTTALGRELADLEATDPDVPAAAAALDDATDRVVHPDDHLKLPTEGKQGKPTPGSSAPGQASTSSATGRAPVAGPSTHREKDPEAAQEMRRAAASGPLDVVDHCAELLRSTADAPTPLVQALRTAALSALAALHLAYDPPARESPVAAAPDFTPAAATGTTFEAFPRAKARKAARVRGRVDLAKARQLLEQGHSCPQIARELGVGVGTVRRALDNAGIPRPDGRTTHSGGRNQIKAYPDQLVADVSRLYLEEQLNQAEVAETLGVSTKVVQSVMARHDIPARPSAAAASQAGHGRAIKLDDTKVAEICRRYTAGESATVLAHAFEVSVPSILHRLRQAGVTIRSRGGAHPAATTASNNPRHQEPTS